MWKVSCAPTIYSILVTEQEYKNMLAQDVLEVTDRSLLPQNTKVLLTTWVLKKKANGVYKGRITARGFAQRDREHFDSSDKASLVVNDTIWLSHLHLVVRLEICGEKSSFNINLPRIGHYNQYETNPNGDIIFNM
jgi:hypothetical protein